MADYSTTMGILQPQVGKSGDILLKIEHKNGGRRGIRREDTVRSEPERSEGNPQESEQSHFLHRKKY